MKKLAAVILVLVIVVITAVVTWRVTMLGLKVDVQDNGVYITSFGQTDSYYLSK